jgi:hypothetical protein
MVFSCASGHFPVGGAGFQRVCHQAKSKKSKKSIIIENKLVNPSVI